MGLGLEHQRQLFVDVHKYYTEDIEKGIIESLFLIYFRDSEAPGSQRP